jgi:hypothetical protein
MSPLILLVAILCVEIQRYIAWKRGGALR